MPADTATVQGNEDADGSVTKNSSGYQWRQWLVRCWHHDVITVTIEHASIAFFRPQLLLQFTYKGIHMSQFLELEPSHPTRQPDNPSQVPASRMIPS